jgi:hypothetical protein
MPMSSGAKEQEAVVPEVLSGTDDQFNKMSPYGKTLYKALGGDTRFLAMKPSVVRHFALERPDSVLNLIDDEELKELVVQLPEELLEKSEPELVELARPDRVDRRLRIAFWDEYERAAAEQRPMALGSITRNTGAISWNWYKNQLVAKPEKLAWFLSQPAAYKMQVQEAEQIGLSRLIEILELPLKNPNGTINVLVGGLILAAFKHVDMRRNGLPTNKQVNINLAQDIPKNATIDPDKLDEKLAELERLLQAKDVTDVQAK